MSHGTRGKNSVKRCKEEKSKRVLNPVLIGLPQLKGVGFTDSVK